MSAIFHTTIDSPIGPLLLAIQDGQLTQIEFSQPKHPLPLDPRSQPATEPFQAAIEQLGEFFRGQRRAFDLPLLIAGTDFQRRVWQQLCEIPYGQTISYGELARRIGNPKAVRAVGLANGRNRLPIVIPCHRVIGANGQLVGFGGGLTIKSQLLQLERQTL